MIDEAAGRLRIAAGMPWGDAGTQRTRHRYRRSALGFVAALSRIDDAFRPVAASYSNSAFLAARSEQAVKHSYDIGRGFCDRAIDLQEPVLDAIRREQERIAARVNELEPRVIS